MLLKGFEIFRQSKNEPVNEIKQKASLSRKNIKKEPEKPKEPKKIIADVLPIYYDSRRILF